MKLTINDAIRIAIYDRDIGVSSAIDELERMGFDCSYYYKTMSKYDDPDELDDNGEVINLKVRDEMYEKLGVDKIMNIAYHFVWDNEKDIFYFNNQFNPLEEATKLDDDNIRNNEDYQIAFAQLSMPYFLKLCRIDVPEIKPNEKILNFKVLDKIKMDSLLDKKLWKLFDNTMIFSSGDLEEVDDIYKTTEKDYIYVESSDTLETGLYNKDEYANYKTKALLYDLKESFRETCLNNVEIELNEKYIFSTISGAGEGSRFLIPLAIDEKNNNLKCQNEKGEIIPNQALDNFKGLIVEEDVYVDHSYNHKIKDKGGR